MTVNASSRCIPSIFSRSHPIWPYGLLIAAFTWAYWPIIKQLLNLWVENEDYSHGFLIIPVAGWLVYRRLRSVGLPSMDYMPWHGQLLGCLAVIFCAFLSIIGNLTGFLTLSYFSLVMAIFGWIYFLFGFGLIRRLSWELGLLVFLIPVPSSVYGRLTIPLQLLTTALSAELFYLLDIPVFRTGNILVLKSTTLQVINACSGLRSIISILVFGYVIGIVSTCSTWVRLLLLLSAIPIAIVVNTFRVLILGLDVERGWLLFGSGHPHVLLGMGLFALSILCLLATQSLISWAFTRK